MRVLFVLVLAFLGGACAPERPGLKNQDGRVGVLNVRAVEPEAYVAYIAGRTFEAKRLVQVAMDVQAMSEQEARTETDTIFRCPEMVNYGPQKGSAFELALRSNPCRSPQGGPLALHFEGWELFQVPEFISLEGVPGVESGAQAPQAMSYKSKDYRVHLESRNGDGGPAQAEADIREVRDLKIKRLEEASDLASGLVAYSFTYTVKSNVAQSLKQKGRQAYEEGSETFRLTATLLYDFRGRDVAFSNPVIELEASIPRWVSRNYGSVEKVSHQVEIRSRAQTVSRKDPAPLILFDENQGCGFPVTRLIFEKFEMETPQGSARVRGSMEIDRRHLKFYHQQTGQVAKLPWTQCQASTNSAARNWTPYEAIYLK